jgi:hypothetical protein
MLNPQRARLILTIALVINANVLFSLLAKPVWAQATTGNEVGPETNVQPVTPPLTKPNGTHGKTSATTSDKKSISDWASLNPAQQKILAPLESDWLSMTLESRQKWAKLANLYPKIGVVEQERLQARMLEWAKLSQKDRRLARDNYLSSLQFPNDKKNEAWQAYQQLPNEEKQKLAARENSLKKPSTATSPSLQNYPANK